MTNRSTEAYNLYERYRDYKRVADEMGISYDAARGMASRGRRAGQSGTVIELGNLREPEPMYEPSIADTLHDYPEYVEWMRWAKRKQRTVKVQVWPDVHLPDENPQAIELAFQIARDFQPDLNLFNGDALDLDLMSTKFPRSHSRRRVDAFQEVKPRLAELVARQKKEVKNSKTLISGGNHGRGRVETWINEHAWMLGETILEDFIQLMRCDGMAWWMGWRDEFQIGSLHAEHGIRVGEFAAKRSLLDLGGAMDRFSSHTHQPSYALNVVYESDGIAETHRRVVESVVTGCLCNIHPHYKRDKRKSRWVNGCLLIHIDMENGIPHMQPRIFKPTANGLLTTAFGDKVYAVAASAKAERKVA